jgi:hypothetical protein
LSFSYIFEPPVGSTVVDVAASFECEIEVSKLVIQESGTSGESGVILKGGGNEIVIVAGAYPYSIAVSGVLSVPHIFEPEYPIDRYTRAPVI